MRETSSTLHELAQEQAGHDCLTGAGVIREEEADPGQGQDVPVDSVELVG